jgi:hypothetical protein
VADKGPPGGNATHCVALQINPSPNLACPATTYEVHGQHAARQSPQRLIYEASEGLALSAIDELERIQAQQETLMVAN